ncbi:unnamed protein product, partial [Polarella glacialis]
FFCAYANGKSAVRVAAARSDGAFPLGSHRWELPGSVSVVEGQGVIDPAEACILHYANCGGEADFVRKYGGRAQESWNSLPFHQLCQRAHLTGGAALRELYKVAVILEDQAEVEQQLSAGVCARITHVRDACLTLKMRLDCMD